MVSTPLAPAVPHQAWLDLALKMLIQHLNMSQKLTWKTTELPRLAVPLGSEPSIGEPPQRPAMVNHLKTSMETSLPEQVGTTSPAEPMMAMVANSSTAPSTMVSGASACRLIQMHQLMLFNAYWVLS